MNLVSRHLRRLRRLVVAVSSSPSSAPIRYLRYMGLMKHTTCESYKMTQKKKLVSFHVIQCEYELDVEISRWQTGRQYDLIHSIEFHQAMMPTTRGISSSKSRIRRPCQWYIPCWPSPTDEMKTPPRYHIRLPLGAKSSSHSEVMKGIHRSRWQVVVVHEDRNDDEY